MKTLFLLPILLLSLISTSCWSVDWNDLKERDDIYYKKFSDTPFTGKVSGENQGKMKNGEYEGDWVKYFDNGQLWSKGSYKNRKKEGDWVSYYDDGTVNSERSGTYKNGKKISD